MICRRSCQRMPHEVKPDPRQCARRGLSDGELRIQHGIGMTAPPRQKNTFEVIKIASS